MRTSPHVQSVTERISLDGEPIDLRPREYEVLVYLLRHRDRIVTRDMLGRDVWSDPDHPLTNVIDVTVANLRRALEKAGGPALIHTVRGTGFVLRDPA